MPQLMVSNDVRYASRPEKQTVTTSDQGGGWFGPGGGIPEALSPQKSLFGWGSSVEDAPRETSWWDTLTSPVTAVKDAAAGFGRWVIIVLVLAILGLLVFNRTLSKVGA